MSPSLPPEFMRNIAWPNWTTRQREIYAAHGWAWNRDRQEWTR